MKASNEEADGVAGPAPVYLAVLAVAAESFRKRGPSLSQAARSRRIDGFIFFCRA